MGKSECNALDHFAIGADSFQFDISLSICITSGIAAGKVKQINMVPREISQFETGLCNESESDCNALDHSAFGVAPLQLDLYLPICITSKRKLQGKLSGPK